MKPSHRIAACLRVLGCAAICAAPVSAAIAAAASAHETEDSNALIMTAEIALQRNDCGRASANYTSAAQHLADLKLAERAATVALDCGQYQAAERAAARWRQLAGPSDSGALRAAMRADLGLFRIDDARAAFEGWIKTSNSDEARHGSARRGAGAQTDQSPDSDQTIAARVTELAQESGVPATLAMLRGVQASQMQSGAALLALSALALDGWNYQDAVQYAQRALNAGAERAQAELVLARAYAGLGDSDEAVTAAEAARAAAPKEQSFATVDIQILLGREREARSALEGLLDSETPSVRAQAERRLGLMAFDRGDYEDAKRIFSGLVKDPESSGIAVYYLSAIAERRGDTATALHGYQLLGGTALEAAARNRAATILYKDGQRSDALQLLQASDDAAPAARLEAEVAQAQLLANSGEGPQALARIDDALARCPGHPDLLYQKAIVLEKTGHTEAAVTQLEGLYRDRPQDGAVSNALGFLLADHNRELPRADKLITSALKSEPDNPAVLDSKAWLEYRQGMAHAALPLLERAFRLDQDGDIGAHWGEVLWNLGDKAKARETWNRALMIDPDNALVKSAQQRAGVPSLPSSGTGTSI
jgi:tetratricopeptide (TPR) repeat protein